MPVNLADMQTLGVVVLSPFFAGAIAAHEGSGWFTPAYAIGGLGLGIAVAYLARFVAYRILPPRADGSSLRNCGAAAAYFLGTPLIAFGGLIGIAWAALNLASRFH